MKMKRSNRTAYGTAKRSTKDENPTLDISSLIDVSFLLLIYFVVTSTLNPTESDLELSMGIPRIGVGAGPVVEEPTIELNDAGVVFFESEMLDINTGSHELVLLLDRLNTYSDASRLIDPQSKGGVRLKISDTARNQRFVDVMNCLAEVGISDVTFLDME